MSAKQIRLDGPNAVRIAARAVLILIITAAFVFTIGAFDKSTAAITLNWTAPTTNTDGSPLTDLVGYDIYYGTSSGNYTNTINVGNVTSYTFTNLPAGTYYFAATAYDSAGIQSTYSNEVVKTVAQQYTLTVSNNSPSLGSVTSSPSGINCGTTCSAVYYAGSIVTLTATPSGSSVFSGWSGGGCSGSGTCSLSINANTAVTATFAVQSQAYSIIASAGTGGSISPTGTTTVNSGGTQPYAIAPAAGYSIGSVTVDGVSVGAVSSYTFSNVTSNHTISATFKINTYTITVSAGTGGSISPTGTTTVNSGSSQTYVIAPAAGYSIGSVTVDGVSVGAVSSYTFSNVTSNHTISATFVANSNGTVTTVTLAPASDTFINLDTNNYSTVTEYSTYTWPSGMVANAILMKFDLSGIPAGATIQSAALNLYMVSSDANTTYPNYNLSLYKVINHNPDLSAATGYTYDGTNSWTPNTDCYNNIPLAQADVSAAYDAEAVNQSMGFKTWNATQLVIDWLANQSANYGLLINSDPAAPADTYRSFASSKNASTNLRPYLTVTYSTAGASSYTITASASTGGSISPTGTTTVNSGGSQTYAIAPAAGYSIGGVMVDGVSVGAVSSYTFSNVTANHTISATFKINTYTITATASTGGSTSPTGTTTVNSGGSQTYAIAPAAGYSIGSVMVDGVSVGAVSSYTFSNLTANHTISATFKINTYTITATASTGGSISPTGTTTVNSGGSQTYAIAPAAGYSIGSVTVDGVSVGAVSSYTFSNLTANHTISATFKINTYTITATASTGGSISPTGTTTVNSGGSQTYAIAPAAGYSIGSVTVDGVSVGAVSSYTFSNVTANHTISVTFKSGAYTITSSAGAGGSISPLGTKTISSGGSQTYIITPSKRYAISNVTVDGVSVGAVSSYTFSNITTKHSITATFKRKY